ncbi:hypothetical protein BHM03_00032408, partial [Ensete ventricosum]
NLELKFKRIRKIRVWAVHPLAPPSSRYLRQSPSELPTSSHRIVQTLDRCLSLILGPCLVCNSFSPLWLNLHDANYDLINYNHDQQIQLKIFPTPGKPSAAPDNLLASLGLLPMNSLTPSLQTPDTLDELPTHSKRVPNRIVLTPARCLDLTLANPLIVISHS